MTRRASQILLFSLIAGCASEAQTGPKVIKVGDPVDINNDGKFDGIAVDRDNDGIADSVDLDGDGIPDALLPGFGPKPSSPDAGNAGDGDGWPFPGDGDQEPGDGDQEPGDGDDDEPLEIDLFIADVPCGGSICQSIGNKLCCESWKRAGFGKDSMCIPEDECSLTSLGGKGKYWLAEPIPGLDPERAVMSRCDGAEDCRPEHICCYVRQGMPLGFSPPNWEGPGAGRQCMAADTCRGEGTPSGVPTGLFSCNDDVDCLKAPGTTCKPEQDNSPTTGKNVKARPGFMVCR